MSTQPRLDTASAGEVQVSGDLTLHTVSGLIVDGQKAIRSAQGELDINLADVSRFSSAGVALLLNWLRTAEAANVAVTIKHPPKDMPAILEVCDLNAVFQPVLSDTLQPE
ncbi:STAS domain-containing protein [Thalassolituus maritimus]|uniref:MlaB-like STAS domain-containing protein n=1 Tax=Thalassolituus maritimus TaxID=484498 RepID=A0ABP9ZWQ4_9GAMM